LEAAERRLKLIKLLCHRRYETMQNLAFEFGVSTRTILRDIDEISDIIPIYCKKGRYDGGVYIEDSYRFEKLYMTNEEIDLLKKIQNQEENHKINLTVKEKSILDTIIKNYSITYVKK